IKLSNKNQKNPSRQQTTLPKESTPKQGQTKQLALAKNDTLLSSQKTNTHRQLTLNLRARIGGNPSTLPHQLDPRQALCPDSYLLAVPPRAYGHRRGGDRQFEGNPPRPAGAAAHTAQPARLLGRPMYSTRLALRFQIRCRTVRTADP